MNIEKIDLHMHTKASDGTDTPAELLQRIHKVGITVFAVTDHDTIDGGLKIIEHMQKDDPAFILGVEFSCKDERGKYHILGYGFDPEKPLIRELLDFCHSSRIGRVQRRIAFLEREYGFTFSKEDLDKLYSCDNPGKPHIGNLMVMYGYTENKEDAILNYINKYKESEKRIRPERAIQAIEDAGGIPVLAHPTFGSGEERIEGDEMEERIIRLKSYGLKGLEAYYSGFTKEMRDELLSFAEKYDLYVTAGSDYHGTNKPVRLGETHLDEDYPQGLIRFLKDVRVRKGE